VTGTAPGNGGGKKGRRTDDGFQWFSENRYLLLLLGITAAFSPALTDVWPRDDIHVASKLAITGAYILLGAETIISQNAWRKARADAKEAIRERDAERAAVEAQLRDVNRHVTERGLQLREVSRRAADLLSDVRRELTQALATRTRESLVTARERTIRGSLSALCDVFESERGGSGDERLDVTFFKATLFEHDPSIGEEGGLARAFWHYPGTKRPQTEDIDFKKHPQAAATRCYREQKMVVLEDVEEEARAGVQWEDLRPSQHSDYAGSSMICVPVWAERGSPVEVRGVVTIDTNRARYFKREAASVEFLNQILEPFLGIIRLMYTVTDHPSDDQTLA
jgi:hypothetical protein